MLPSGNDAAITLAHYFVNFLKKGIYLFYETDK
jgi:hypothetical protein